MYLGMGIVKLTLYPNDLYFYFSIAVCLRGKLNYEDGKININCSCGYITNHLWCGCLYNFFIFSIICYFLTNNNVIYIEDEHLHYLITLSRCCLKNWGGGGLAGFFRVLKVKPFGEFRNLFCRLLLGILNQ